MDLKDQWFDVMINSDLKDIYRNVRFLNKKTNEVFNNVNFWNEYLYHRFHIDEVYDDLDEAMEVVLLIDQTLDIFFQTGFEYVSVSGFCKFIENNLYTYGQELVDGVAERLTKRNSQIASEETFYDLNSIMNTSPLKVSSSDIVYTDNIQFMQDLSSYMYKPSLWFTKDHRIKQLKINDNFVEMNVVAGKTKDLHDARIIFEEFIKIYRRLNFGSVM